MKSMSSPSKASAKATLDRIARRAMKERGFLTDFSLAVLDEVDNIQEVSWQAKAHGKDLRHLLWVSIDNDDSLDLDQLTVTEPMPDKRVRILVAVADVDSLAKRNSAIDGHARHNTTSVYTAGKVFPMLPERLSTDLTSLNFQADRPAIVIEMVAGDAGDIQRSDIYPAVVRNHARLAYDRVAAWLEGDAPSPVQADAISPSIGDSLRVQDSIAQKLRSRRHERGALDLQTVEARPVFAGDEIQDLRPDEKNRAREIIEDFMIAANDVTARFLRERRVPSLRRVVRSPKRWDRIVEIAAQYDSRLPRDPDPRALADFLTDRKRDDPSRFPDLSLSIIKLLGPGEYVVELPGEAALGHFGLASKDYMHSTAPNRRFPDLVTQRILKATLSGSPTPYTPPELVQLARHCTEKEDDANKVERLVIKSAAAMMLSSSIGNEFDAICTGAADKGTWVRVFRPPIEGRLLRGFEGVDVGNRLKVRLIHTDVDRGFIDFEKVH